MGNKASRMDRYYGNYEKSFERVEKDVQRVKGQLVARGRSRAKLGVWTSMVISVTVVIAAAIIYQIQQQPPGTFTYQQHFNRTASAMAVPAVAVLLHYVLALVMDLQQRRDTRRLQRLEEAKRGMLKELKEMTRFDRVKTLIDRFDPDAGPPPAAARQHGMMLKMNGAAGGGRGQPGQVPAMLVKGSGQVAGAAALAVAGAGKALMPLIDKLATSLISDNPLLLEDLRHAQQQLQDAQVRTVGAVQESYGVKQENLDLKRRLLELEQQLGLPPSFDPEVLQEAQEQLHQQAQQAQQAAWQVQLQQQYLQPAQQGQGSGSFEGNMSGSNYAAAAAAAQSGNGAGLLLPSTSSRPGSAGKLAAVDTPAGTPKAAN